ncbi:serine/threonine-protein kinase pim-2-like, partial [Neoarius graeffei]|uniref:serine/threonine-protein kinase pim-2-like n=1 Tax=Neoarius graeffei TaxID=443677 RepID=UPI00298D4E86
PLEKKILPLEVVLMEIVSKPPCCKNVMELLEWFEMPDFFILVLERPVPCMDLQKFCAFNNYHGLRGGNQSTQRKPTQTWGEHANSTQKGPCRPLGSNPEPSCCEATVPRHLRASRDIKLENILINLDTLEVKLINFGCGKLLTDEVYKDNKGYVEEPTTHRNTNYNSPGTPCYFPLEMILSGKYFAIPATVWYLGVTLLSGFFCKKKRKSIPLSTIKSMIKNLKYSLVKAIHLSQRSNKEARGNSEGAGELERLTASMGEAVYRSRHSTKLGAMEQW